jgi:hypothetical protein
MDKQLESKAVNLYENHYVDFIRTCDQHGRVYFKAQVRAEMKTNVVYPVDIFITDQRVVKEAQCECAAGMGPHAHCKHVVCVLYGLSEFAGSRTFKTVQTCTQQLQTFHQAKKHLGSPVKARDLPLCVSQDINFDPRPILGISYVKYCYVSSLTMTEHFLLVFVCVCVCVCVCTCIQEHTKCAYKFPFSLHRHVYIEKKHYFQLQNNIIEN